MFIVVVVLFTVCWLPYHGYFVYQFINHKVISSKYVQHIFLAFYWMAMSNAMINPLVYYWMNARYTNRRQPINVMSINDPFIPDALLLNQYLLMESHISITYRYKNSLPQYFRTDKVMFSILSWIEVHKHAISLQH